MNLTAKKAEWWPANAICFDTETTGVDPEADRIVSAHCVEVGPGGANVLGNWLINPGVNIPAEATAVHGITNEHAKTNGVAPSFAVAGMLGVISRAWHVGMPLIAMNAFYDLTILMAEAKRHGLGPIAIGPVLDPLAIDRGMEPWRKGGRKLADLAERYRVKQGAAHSASGDCLTAGRVVWAQAKEHWTLAHFTLEQMQVYQRESHAKWATRFNGYLRSKGEPANVGLDWPVSA